MKTHAYNFFHRQIHNGKHKYDKNSSKTRDWKMEYKIKFQWNQINLQSSTLNRNYYYYMTSEF